MEILSEHGVAGLPLRAVARRAKCPRWYTAPSTACGKVRGDGTDCSATWYFANVCVNRPATPFRDAISRDAGAHLRIPVTAEQKAKIMLAGSLEVGDMASWARPLLLKAADEQLEGARKANGHSKGT